jgi:hypothetical protein
MPTPEKTFGRHDALPYREDLFSGIDAFQGDCFDHGAILTTK